ncbi:MAG: hypothetical protein U0132_21785 [Gemmatimonadaceae bacterium]
MTILAAILLVTLLLCAGGYWVGTRSGLLAVVLTIPLVVGAWRLIGVKLEFGEGAAAGVAVFFAGVWYLGLTCGLVAISLLGGSFRARRSLGAAALMVCVAMTLAVRIESRLSDKKPGAATAPAAGSPAATPPRSTYTEGYAWAVDNGVSAEADCANGSPEFLDGCRAAVHAH